jgi:hypothetical protein
MTATTAPPKLILTASAPLDGFVVEELWLPEAEPATVEEAAAERVDGRDIVGLAEMMELLENGEPVE